MKMTRTSANLFILLIIIAREASASEDMIRYNVLIEGVNAAYSPKLNAAFVVSDTQIIFSPYEQGARDNNFLSVRVPPSGGSGCRNIPDTADGIERSFCVDMKRYSDGVYSISYIGKLRRKSQTNIDINHLEFELHLTSYDFGAKGCYIIMGESWYKSVGKKYSTDSFSIKECVIF